MNHIENRKIREIIEQHERDALSARACLSCNSKGRQRPEDECDLRTCFQHDRDRILHSKSFRRLKHKTQVFLSPEGDHYRTRLTHTLEVAQIARTIARALFLNEDLTEAIALGHDLGHTPFGHVGERVLNRLCDGGFHHVRQSLRVVDVLEKDGRGLNLTAEVRDGILHHSKGNGPVDGGHKAATLEGQIVRYADIVAYVNHDLDDALRSGVVTAADVPACLLRGLGERHSRRINTMVNDIIAASQRSDTICMSAAVLQMVTQLRQWLFANVYRAAGVQTDFDKAGRVLEELYRYFADNPEKLRDYGALCLPGGSTSEWICDFLAGMTDRYAIKLYRDIFLPRPWAAV